MTNTNSKKTVVALGKFDGLHKGHLRLLFVATDIAKKTSGVPTILFIGTPLSYLMSPCESAQKARNQGIENICRHELTPEFRSMSGDEFVSRILVGELNCSHVVVGYNFRFSQNRSCDANDLKNMCAAYGIECTIIDEITVSESDGSVHPVSSSRIRDLISCGRVEEIRTYLGEDYCLRGTVSHGKHLGTGFGFPTANLIPDKGRLIPSAGVYATSVRIDDTEYAAVTNVGTNPTVNDKDNVTVETHILGFCGDIYEKEITVRFLKKIRNEIKFESIDALKNQIDKDCREAKKIFEMN